MSEPGLRVLFHMCDGDTLRSIAPVTDRDKDAFFGLLKEFNISPNAHTRVRSSNDPHDDQAAFINKNGRIVCDISVAEKLADAGVPLHVRTPGRPVT